MNPNPRPISFRARTDLTLSCTGSGQGSESLCLRGATLLSYSDHESTETAVSALLADLSMAPIVTLPFSVAPSSMVKRRP